MRTAVDDEDAQAKGWTIWYSPKVLGRLNEWEPIQKGELEGDDVRVMKTTKRMVVDGGVLWQTETIMEKGFRLQGAVPGTPGAFKVETITLSQGLTFQPDPTTQP